MTKSYYLGNPRTTALEAPYTFFLPTEEEALAVEVGDLVQLIFCPVPDDRKYGAERMWVVVDEIDGLSLRGRLDNNPSDMPQLKLGDIVEFENSHIISIKTNDGRNPYFSPRATKQYWDRCIVDDCVLYEEVPVGYLYREEPDMNQDDDKDPDSGWRIRGDFRNCSDDEIENREASYVALGSVLNRDDSWLHLIDEPTGSAFERDFETGEYVREVAKEG